jgi:hypothetical protein
VDNAESVQFSCTNLPANVTCQFSLSTVTLNGSAMTTQLTVSEGAAGNAQRVNIKDLIGPGGRGEKFSAIAEKSKRTQAMFSFSFALFGGMLLLGAIGRRSPVRKHRAFALVIACLAPMTMATAMAGCSSSPGTPASSTITIQANANGQNV